MSGIDCYNESVGCHAAANLAEFELIKLDGIKGLFLYFVFCTLVSGEADGEYGKRIWRIAATAEPG